MAIGASTTDDIQREARAVGLREGAAPTLEGIERRRLQLWGVGLGLLLAVSVGVAFLSTAPASVDGAAVPAVLRIAIVLLPVAFGAYAIEKEVRLRRLTRMVTDQQLHVTDLTRRLGDLALLLEAGKAMNSVLELPRVLETILRTAIEVLAGYSGSIMLLESHDELVTVCTQGPGDGLGQRVRIGSGAAGRAAGSRTPLLVEERELRSDAARVGGDGEIHSVVCLPLIGRGVLFGVLSVRAEPNQRYVDDDLKVASLFAEQAAGAIANARLFETERLRGDRAELASEFRSLT